MTLQVRQRRQGCPLYVKPLLLGGFNSQIDGYLLTHDCPCVLEPHGFRMILGRRRRPARLWLSERSGGVSPSSMIRSLPAVSDIRSDFKNHVAQSMLAVRPSP